MDAAPLIHIGYPKTGTTLLQRHVFAVDPAVRTVGRLNPDYEDASTGLRHGLLVADAPTFDARADTLRTAIAPRPGERDDRVPVLSDEHIATGAALSPVATQSPETILKRVSALWPAAQILIVIRRQPALLLGIHRNLLRMDRIRQRFDDWVEALDTDPDHIVLETLNFERYIAEAGRIFGSERIHIAVYEDLIHAPDRFAATLSAATCIPFWRCRQYMQMSKVNASSPVEDVYLAIRRRVPKRLYRNPLLQPLRSLINLERIRGLAGGGSLQANHPRSLRARNEEFLNTYYAPSNAALSRRLERDLGWLGYPVEAHAEGSRRADRKGEDGLGE